VSREIVSSGWAGLVPNYSLFTTYPYWLAHTIRAIHAMSPMPSETGG
jgi:hypothetical protein